MASKAKSLTSLAACVDLEKLSNYKKREVRLCCEAEKEGPTISWERAGGLSGSPWP